MPDFEDIPINATAEELEAVARMGTAPEDDKTYGRKNGEWVEVIADTVPLVSGSDMAAAVSAYLPAYNNGYIVQCSSTYENQYFKGQTYQFNRNGPLHWWNPVNVDFYRKTGEQIDKSNYQMMTSDVDIFLCTEDYASPSSILTDDTAFHQGYSYLYTGIDGTTFKKKFTRINTQPSSGGGGTSDLGLLGSSDTLAVGSVEVENAPAKNSNNLITSGAVFGAVNPTYELIEKIIIGYSITTQEPADWSTNYTDYFTNTGTAREPVYTAVTGESAPTWQSGTYYSYQSDGVQILDVYKEPDGIDYSFKHLYLTFEQGGSSIINGAFFFATALYPNISAIGGEHYGGFVTALNYASSQKHIIRAGINGNLGYYFNWYNAYNRMSDYSDQPILSAQETAITGWRLRRTSNGALLSGTAIYVYGVR